MPGLDYNPFDGDEYVAMSLIRKNATLPVARDERKRTLITIAAVLFGYMLVVFGLSELSAHYY
jgi:LPS O-antigen subunit length determinant protein (WzzB/FepE family)